eukprot:SAG22_NODE_658_length_8076_cov_4.575279_4_plen_300_part_00
MDMDFGGRLTLGESTAVISNAAASSGIVCNYAPIIAIYTDSITWATEHAPGWYSGPILNQANMTSPYECQTRCQNTEGCVGFAYEYEYEPDDQTYYHECYVKNAFANAHSSSTAAAYAGCSGDDCALSEEDVALCMEYPYIPWTEPDGDYHSASGLADCEPAGGYKIDYMYSDIRNTGTIIKDDQWVNALNTWADDDGMFDIPLPFGFLWYGQVEMTATVGTNGLITFGSNHLRNGGSEPIPCVGEATVMLLKAVITAFPSFSLPFLAVPLRSQRTVAIRLLRPQREIRLARIPFRVRC